MPWGLIGGALLGAAADIFTSDKDRKQNQQQFNQDVALQKEFAQHGISWRVADAKASGLHPLYALGGQIPTYTPSARVFDSGTNFAAAGAHAGSAVDQWRERRRQEQIAGEDRVEAEGRDSVDRHHTVRMMDAEYAKAQQDLQLGALRLQQEAQANKERMAGRGLTGDAVEYVPDQVVMGNAQMPGYVAGVHEGMKRWRLGEGFYLDLPWSNEGIAESIEGLGPAGKLAIIAYNSKLHGPEWVARAKEMLGWTTLFD